MRGNGREGENISRRAGGVFRLPVIRMVWERIAGYLFDSPSSAQINDPSREITKRPNGERQWQVVLLSAFADLGDQASVAVQPTTTRVPQRISAREDRTKEKVVVPGEL